MGSVSVCSNRLASELQKALERIDHKCWYYKTALDAGTEKIHNK